MRWRAELEERTRIFRRWKAAKHHEQAADATRKHEHTRATWHRQRAMGQRKRFERIEQCGERELVLVCDDCGHEKRTRVARCQQWRVCLSCRRVRAARYRAMFEQARAEVLRKLWHKMQPARGAQRYGEKFLTLTLRHSGDVRKDIRALSRAWRKFLRMVNKHFEREWGKAIDLVWVRVCEVTPGEDGLGHAHVHVWCLWPYVPQVLLGTHWGAALASEGYECETRSLSSVLEEVEEQWRRDQLRAWLVVRRGRSTRELDPVPNPVILFIESKERVGNELLKYLIKDAVYTAEGRLEPMDAALFAKIYEGFETVRSVQTSLGFWIRCSPSTKHTSCAQCGGASITTKTKRIETAPSGGDDA